MCSPCRASVLTGLMPSQHGIHNWLDDNLMDQWPQNWPAIRGRGENEFAGLYDRADMHSVRREGLSNAVLERFGLRVAEGGLREQFKGPLLLPNNVESLRNYFSQVSLIDDGVGQILQALDRLRLDRDTLVIYTADHGFSLGHNGIWGHWAAAFPASAHRPSYHIPLIMAGARGVTGAVSDAMVSQIELFPTLARLAGSDAVPSLPSTARDLGPALRGEVEAVQEAVFMEQEETRAMRTRDWLFVKRFQGASSYPLRDALYDLNADPQEKTDVSDLPENAAVLRQMDAALGAHFAQHTVPRYDLWQGGTAKSNVTYPKFWQDAWGADWQPEVGALSAG